MAELIRISVDSMLRGGSVKDDEELRRKAAAAAGSLCGPENLAEALDQRTSALLAANRHSLSLADCTSFEILRRIGLDTVIPLDPHFREQGFHIIPRKWIVLHECL